MACNVVHSMYISLRLSKKLVANKQWWFGWLRSKRSWFSSNAESSFHNGSKTQSSFPAGKTWAQFLPKVIVEKMLSWSKYLLCSWLIGWRWGWIGIPYDYLENSRSLLTHLAKKLWKYSWFDCQEDFETNEANLLLKILDINNLFLILWSFTSYLCMWPLGCWKDY